MLAQLICDKYKAHIENGTVDAGSLASQNLCCHQMERRLVHPGLSANAVGPATPVTELVNLQANVGKVSNFTVFIEVRCSTAATSVDKILGKTCVPYPETTTFQGERSLCILHVEICTDQVLENSFETVCDCQH